MKNYSTIIGSRSSFVFRLPIFVIILLSFFLILTQTASCVSIEGSIIYVNKYADDNFSSVQDGIDAAREGDTVFVYRGTYYENIVIDKSITLIGEEKNGSIIDGRETGNVIKINADNVTIKSLTIQHSGLIFPNSGINISSNHNIIMDNNIIDNFYGITLYVSSHNLLIDNLIQNDTHCGIYMSKSSNNKILNNSIKNNRYNGIGVYDYSNSNVIQNNSLTQNNYCGINIRISSNNIIIGNNLSENNIGIHLPDSENMFHDNVLYNNKLDVDREFFLIRTEFIFLMVVVSITLGLVVYLLFRKKKNLRK